MVSALPRQALSHAFLMQKFDPLIRAKQAWIFAPKQSTLQARFRPESSARLIPSKHEPATSVINAVLLKPKQQ
jgi:hypothetical protein